jgi:hypothetical protein
LLEIDMNDLWVPGTIYAILTVAIATAAAIITTWISVHYALANIKIEIESAFTTQKNELKVDHSISIQSTGVDPKGTSPAHGAEDEWTGQP